MASKRQSLVTDQMIGEMSAKDKEKKFAPGTMYALMMQESSGTYGLNEDHYLPDANGKRKSSAFGPFGFLAGTIKDPGFGVKPLNRDTATFSDHLAFAADYLGKRGLAAYGEGENYANQVRARIPGAKQPVAAPVMPTQLAQAPMPVPQQVVQEAPQAPVQLEQPMLAQQVMPQQEADPWVGMQQVMPQPILPNALAYGGSGGAQQSVHPNFKAFGSFKGRA